MRFLPRLFARIIHNGTLTLIDPEGGRQRFGGQGPGPDVTVQIKDRRLDWQILLAPELAPAEAYMDQRLEIDPGPHALTELFFLNRRGFDMTLSQIWWRTLRRRVMRLLHHNPISRARANARHHYDLGNAFYRQWLDPDMQYSCAYFVHGTETLAEAQLAKKRHIAAKLALSPGMRVLDIGCGWGGMALYLAAVAEVEVVGVTLAEAQLAVAAERARLLGLEDRVSFRLQDYRQVRDRFDRVVSVGMLEHVGMNELLRYFVQLRDCLAPDGVALIHSISSKSPPGYTAPFIAKYIFPGGYIPRLSELFGVIERAGLWAYDVEILRLHYARTLAAWRDRFAAVRDAVVATEGERFARMWEFYLAVSELSFSHASNMVAQVQLGRGLHGVPLTRDYLAAAEARLAAAEQVDGVAARVAASAGLALDRLEGTPPAAGARPAAAGAPVAVSAAAGPA